MYLSSRSSLPPLGFHTKEGPVVTRIPERLGAWFLGFSCLYLNPVSQFPFCVTLGKLLNFSVPVFVYLWAGNDNYSYLLVVLWGLNELICIKFEDCDWHVVSATHVLTKKASMLVLGVRQDNLLRCINKISIVSFDSNLLFCIYFISCIMYEYSGSCLQFLNLHIVGKIMLKKL